MATIKDFFVKQGAQAVSTIIAGQGLTNYIQIAGGASASPVSVTALGGDTNIGVNIVTKGSGILMVNGNPITANPGGTNGQVQYNNNGVFGGYNTTGTGNVVFSSAPSVVGGSFTALTTLAVRNTGTGVFDLTLAHNGTLTAGRTLTINVLDTSRTLSLSGDLTLGGSFSTIGAFATTLTATGTSTLTLPTTGTLTTLDGVEAFSNKTIISPLITAPSYGVASITAGTNAQGQGTISSDINVITTTATSPSGVTLPLVGTGRLITIVNKGTNSVNIYPATSTQIDGLGINTPISLPVNGYITFSGQTGTQWYSSAQEIVNGSQVTGNISGAAGSLSPGAQINGTTFTGASNITITAANPTALTINNGGAGATSGTTYNGSTAITVSYNTVGAPSTTGTNASGTWAISITGTAAIATTATTSNDNSTNANYFPTFVSAATGNNSITVNSTRLTFNPSSGVLSSTSFTGAGTGLTGTAFGLSIGGNASTATSATSAGSVTNSVTFNNGGTGSASGTAFNGSATVTVSHNTVGAVALAGSTMTGSLTLSGDPTQALHAATKQYVDAARSGLDIKDSVRAATTTTLTITARTATTLTVGGTTFTLDGITLTNNDRVLVKDTTTGVAGSGSPDNGIYVVSGVGTAIVLTRTTDADTGTELNGGMFTFIEQGTLNADTGWVCTTDGAVTIGTTSITFSQFSGAGSVVAGNGLVRVGTALHFATSANYGVGSIFFAGTSTSVSQLANTATGNVLISQGTGNAPSYNKINLDTTGIAHVTGTLQVGSGGSGAATFTTGYLKASGTSAFTTVSTIPGADISGNISGNATNVTGIVAIANGGTGTAVSPTQFGVIFASTTTAFSSTTAGIAKQVLVSNQTSAPTYQTLDMTYLPDAMWKKTAKVASTAQQALSGGTAYPTIDGIATTATDRVLLKNQTAPAENGLYTVGGTSTAWTLTRTADADSITEIAVSVIGVDVGTANGGKVFHTTIKTTDTLNTTAMSWFEILDTSLIGNAAYVPSTTGTGASGTWNISITGNAATATSAGSATNATNTTNVGVTDDTTTNATMYPAWVTAVSGNNPIKVSSTKITFNPATATLTVANVAGNASSATATGITDDTATNSTHFVTFVTTASGNQVHKVASTKLTFNPSTGVLSATSFSGAFTGNASSASQVAVTDDTTTNATYYPTFSTVTSGNSGLKLSSTKLTYNPSTGSLTASALSAGTTGTITGGTVAIGVNSQLATANNTVASTSQTSVDTFSSTIFRGARYTVTLTDTVTSNYEIAELLIVHNGTTPYITSFGNVFTGTNSLGTFDASIATGTVTVTFAGATANSTTIKWIRTLIAV